MRTATDVQLAITSNRFQADFHIAQLAGILTRVADPNLVFIATDDAQFAGAMCILSWPPEGKSASKLSLPVS
jgi:hypothetical protein